MDFPCKNCITLSICRAKVVETKFRAESKRYLFDKCSLVRHYIYLKIISQKLESINHWVEVIDFLEGKLNEDSM